TAGMAVAECLPPRSRPYIDAAVAGGASRGRVAIRARRYARGCRSRVCGEAYLPLGPTTLHLAQGSVDRAAERARQRNPDVKITVDIVPEEAEVALLREARHAAAVVTRGRGPIRGALLGSVSRSLATHATGPVIVVRGTSGNRQGTNGRIVIGVGEAATGTAAIRFAFREAEARRCALDAVRVWRRPAHRPLAHPLFTGVPGHHDEDQAATPLDDALRAPEHEHPDVPVHRVTAEGPARHVRPAHALGHGRPARPRRPSTPGAALAAPRPCGARRAPARRLPGRGGAATWKRGAIGVMPTRRRCR
ncbi:universal stress protein, partial [Streptomyces caelestis]|uniref:universal stress protein n=1 Tax=Streptomyces caelestis TaxID=36816 RepID=UPI003F4D4DEF